MISVRDGNHNLHPCATQCFYLLTFLIRISTLPTQHTTFSPLILVLFNQSTVTFGPFPPTFCSTDPHFFVAMPALITLLHGNASGLLKLVQIFRKKWTMQVKKDETVSESSWEEHCPISKRQLERKITTIAKKERRSTMPKARWYVHHHILAQYKMEDIPLLKNGSIGCHIEQTSPVSKVGPFTPSIRQFTQNATSPFGIKYNGMKVQVKSCDTMEETPMDTSPV